MEGYGDMEKGNRSEDVALSRWYFHSEGEHRQDHSPIWTYQSSLCGRKDLYCSSKEVGLLFEGK